MKGSDLFVRCLEAEGVEYVFGVPGEENLDLLESLRPSSIRLIVTRHEQHGAFMAATYGRLTGKAGVCLSTLGPGATNLLTGVAHAQLCGAPLVAITGQKPLRSNWQGDFQLLDVVSTFLPLTKWNSSLPEADRIPETVRHAFKLAENERPGACHIELPEDVAQESTEAQAFGPSRPRRPVADADAVGRAAELIRSARRPLVLISSGASRRRVTGPLARLLEHTGMCAVTTQMGKGVLPEDHLHFLGCLGMHRTDYVHGALRDADLVVTVGYDVVEYPPSVWNPRDADKKVLHLDFELANPDPHYSPDVELVGDICHSLEGLRKALPPGRIPGSVERFRSELATRLALPETQSFPPSPAEVVAQVRRTMGSSDVVTLDNGIYKLWFARMYPTYAADTLLLDNALATMGAGLGMAMATKLVRPDRRVLAVCGDGGFMMNSQDLETCVRLGLDLVVLILKDDAYGFIEWKQSDAGFARYGMDFGNPDFVKYAQAYGATGLRADGEQPLHQVLARAFEHRGPVLVECPIDYTDNAQLNRDLSRELSPCFEPE